MSASNETWVFHLTPDGWIAGSEYLDFSKIERPVPENTVLTVTRSEYMGSSFSRIETTWDETFRSEDTSLVERLIAQYGARP
jgi:hypothetical protein